MPSTGTIAAIVFAAIVCVLLGMLWFAHRDEERERARQFAKQGLAASGAQRLHDESMAKNSRDRADLLKGVARQRNTASGRKARALLGAL